MNKIDQDVEVLIQKIEDLEEMQRLKELNDIIKEKYHQEIVDFKLYEQKFNECKSYGKYHPDYGMYQQKLHDARIALNEKPEVREYKKLERQMDQMLGKIASKIKGELLWLKEKE